ncbi:MAG: hypothetical protein ACJAT7_001671 [Psychromonas sp.]|jgi:hypothetical protein
MESLFQLQNLIFWQSAAIQKAIKAGISVITYDSDFDELTLTTYKNLRLA